MLGSPVPQVKQEPTQGSGGLLRTLAVGGFLYFYSLSISHLSNLLQEGPTFLLVAVQEQWDLKGVCVPSLPIVLWCF